MATLTGGIHVVNNYLKGRKFAIKMVVDLEDSQYQVNRFQIYEEFNLHTQRGSRFLTRKAPKMHLRGVLVQRQPDNKFKFSFLAYWHRLGRCYGENLSELTFSCEGKHISLHPYNFYGECDISKVSWKYFLLVLLRKNYSISLIRRL